MSQSNPPEIRAERRFVSERELAPIIGRQVRTLQKDRLLSSGPFPFYRVAGSIRYDLAECLEIVRKTRSGGKDFTA